MPERKQEAISGGAANPAMTAGQTPGAVPLKKEEKEEEDEEESTEMGEEEMMEWALRTLERTMYLSESDSEEEEETKSSKSSDSSRSGVSEEQQQQAAVSRGETETTGRRQISQGDVTAQSPLASPSTAVSHTSVNSEQAGARLCFTPALHVEPSEDPLALPVKTEQPTSHQSCMKQERVSDVPCQTPPQPQTSTRAETLPSEALPSCMLRQTLPSQPSVVAQPQTSSTKAEALPSEALPSCMLRQTLPSQPSVVAQPQTSSTKAEALPSEALPSCMLRQTLPSQPSVVAQPQTSSIKAEALPSEALPSCMLRQTSQPSTVAQPSDPSSSCNESDMSRQRQCEREGAALDSPLLPPAVKTEPSDGLPHTTAAFEGQSEDQLTVTVKTENEVQSNESLVMEVDPSYHTVSWSIKNSRRVEVQVAANQNDRMDGRCNDIQEDVRGDPPHFQCYFCGLVLDSMEHLHSHLEGCCPSTAENDNASSGILDVAADEDTSCIMPVIKVSTVSPINTNTVLPFGPQIGHPAANSHPSMPVSFSATGSATVVQGSNVSATSCLYTPVSLLPTPQPVSRGPAVSTVSSVQTPIPVSLLSDSTLTSAPEPADKPAQEKPVEQECSVLPGDDASASGVTTCERNVLMGGTEGASQCDSERNLSPSLRPSERTLQDKNFSRDCAAGMSIAPVCALNTPGQNIPPVISCTGSTAAIQSSNTSSVTPSYTSAPLLSTPQLVGSGSTIGTVSLAQTPVSVSLLSDSTLTSAPEPADKPAQEKTVEQECSALPGGDALTSGMTTCERNVLMGGNEGPRRCSSERSLSPSLRPSERTFQDCATAMNVPPVCALNTSGQNIPLIISSTGSTTAVQSSNTSTPPSYTSTPLLPTPQPVGSGSAIGTVCLAQTSAPVTLLSDSTLTSAPEPADKPAQEKTVEQECSALPGGDALTSGMTTCERNVLMGGNEGPSRCSSERSLSPSLRPSERTFQDCATAMNVPPVCALNTSGQNIPLIISSTGSTTAVQSSNTSTPPSYTSTPLLPTPQPVGSGSAIGTVCLAQTSAPVTLLSDSTLTSAPEPADKPAQEKTVEQECSALPGGDALTSGMTTCERNVLMGGNEGPSRCSSERSLSPSLRPSERTFQDCATAMNVPPVCALNTSGQNIPLIISSTGSTTAVQSSNTSTPPSYTSTPLLPTPQPVGSGSAIGTVCLAQTSAPMTLLSDSTLTSAPEPADRPAQEKTVEQECVILDLQVGKQASNSHPRRPQMVPSTGSTIIVQSGNTNVTPSYYHHVPLQPRPQLVSHGSAINVVGFLFPLPPPLPMYVLHQRNFTAVPNHMDKPEFTNKVPIPRLYRRELAKCVKCGEKLRSTKDCFEHSKRHFSIRKVEESANGGVSSDPRAVNVEESEGYICPLCDKPMGVGGNLVDHVASHWPVSCDRCGARFKTEGGLEKHQPYCRGRPSTSDCPLCQHNGWNYQNLSTHMLLHLKYICPVCCDYFQHKDRFMSHLRNHMEVEEVKCQICGETYQTPYDLSIHMQRSHKSSLYARNRLYAHQGFNYKESLHTSRGPPFQCDKCKRTFSRKLLLLYHFKKACFKELYVGTGIKCEECGKEFVLPSLLRVHWKRTHHKGSKEACPNKKVVCDICGKLVRAKIFKMHTLRHGERKLSCDICGFAFHVKHNLQIHMRKHTGERPYKCEQCGDRFKTPGHLINHRETHKPRSERRRVVRRRPDDPPTRAPKIPN